MSNQHNIDGITITFHPDLEVLIDLADLYEVDIRELIDGERKVNEGKAMEGALKSGEEDTLKRWRSMRKMRKRCWQGGCFG